MIIVALTAQSPDGAGTATTDAGPRMQLRSPKRRNSRSKAAPNASCATIGYLKTQKLRKPDIPSTENQKYLQPIIRTREQGWAGATKTASQPIKRTETSSLHDEGLTDSLAEMKSSPAMIIIT